MIIIYFNHRMWSQRMYNTPIDQAQPKPAVSNASRADSITTTHHLDSRVLLNGAQEVRIAHYGQEYRLRQTRNGKLILTK
jgi:hemin uptake protein HemP